MKKRNKVNLKQDIDNDARWVKHVNPATCKPENRSGKRLPSHTVQIVISSSACTKTRNFFMTLSHLDWNRCLKQTKKNSQTQMVSVRD